LTIEGRGERSGARVVAQRLGVGEHASGLLLGRSDDLLALGGLLLGGGLGLSEGWRSLDVCETGSGLGGADFLLGGDGGAGVVTTVARTTLVDRLGDFATALGPGVDLEPRLLRARRQYQRRTSNNLVHDDDLQPMLLAESKLLIVGGPVPHLLPHLFDLADETEVRGGKEVDVLPDARKLILGDPLLHGVIGHLVEYDAHEAGIEVDALANGLEVREGDVLEAADREKDVLADLVAAQVARDAEGVTGVVDLASERQRCVGGERREAQRLRVVDVVLVDILQNEAAGVVVDWRDDDLAGELLASHAGKTNELRLVVGGAEEEFASVGLEEEYVRVVNALAGRDAHLGELLGDAGVAASLVGRRHRARLVGYGLFC
jgi:hypothetical protein